MAMFWAVSSVGRAPALPKNLAPRRPFTPPWIRLFLNSVQAPHSTQRRHAFLPCDTCESSATFAVLAWPQPYIAAICTLCLQCGYVTNRITAASAPLSSRRSRTLSPASRKVVD